MQRGAARDALDVRDVSLAVAVEVGEHEVRRLGVGGEAAAYEAIRRDGTQQNVLDLMQTREDLYRYLGYYDFERKLDALFAKQRPG